MNSAEPRSSVVLRERDSAKVWRGTVSDYKDRARVG